MVLMVQCYNRYAFRMTIHCIVSLNIIFIIRATLGNHLLVLIERINNSNRSFTNQSPKNVERERKCDVSRKSATTGVLLDNM